MDPGQFVCRSAVHPKYMKEDVFDTSILFGFMEDKALGARVSSVTSRELLGSVPAVHKAGQIVAEKSNEREAARLETNLKRDPNYEIRVFHYLGFYQIECTRVGFNSDYHRVELNWRPEDGSDAHYQLEIYEDTKPPTRAEGRSDRNFLITMLADLLNGPELCPIAAEVPELRKLQQDCLAELTAD